MHPVVLLEVRSTIVIDNSNMCFLFVYKFISVTKRHEIRLLQFHLQKIATKRGWFDGLRPAYSSLKTNTDGSSFDNLGHVGIGGLVHDKHK